LGVVVEGEAAEAEVALARDAVGPQEPGPRRVVRAGDATAIPVPMPSDARAVGVFRGAPRPQRRRGCRRWSGLHRCSSSPHLLRMQAPPPIAPPTCAQAMGSMTATAGASSSLGRASCRRRLRPSGCDRPVAGGGFRCVP
jgi:hypothetical protein